MIDLIVLLLLGIGILLVLVGLVMIAQQVRVHAIEVYSTGSWLYRAGAVMSIVGLVVMLVTGAAASLSSVGLMAGIAGGFGGLFVLNHEREQAIHGGTERWDWPRSLTLQMIVLALVIIALSIVV